MNVCGVCIYIHYSECVYAYRRRLHCHSYHKVFQNPNKKNDNCGLRFFVYISLIGIEKIYQTHEFLFLPSRMDKRQIQ